MTSTIERPRFTCALGGALTTVTALPKGIPVLHTSPGCAGNTAWTQLGGGGLQTGGYCASLSVPSTNVLENEVVFGGADRLREEIRHAFDVMKGGLYVIIPGCVPALIGDDVDAVVREFRKEGYPVILARTSGFKGNSYVGYDEVLRALFTQFVEKTTARDPTLVNLWGIVPVWDPFWRGNIAELGRLLRSLGLRANTFFTHDDSLGSIRRAARAALNIVVSDLYGIEAAHAFEAEHGTPFLQLPMPIGPTATTAFLREVGARVLPQARQRRLARVIADEEETYFGHVESLADVYSDLDLQRYAVVVADANYGVALPRFLASDLGWLPELVVHTDIVDETARARLAARQDALPPHLRPKVAFETDTARVRTHVDALRPSTNGGTYHDPLSPAFVLGSSLDRPLAASIGAGHLSVSFPVANRAILDRGYVGSRGGLRLTEDLLSALVAGR